MDMKPSTLLTLAFIGLAAGLAYRLYPIVMGQPALSEAFMTEDGYLMLTVARNMALGLGMTVSDGTIPTNGVQPLATLLFTIPYLLTGGDKVTSLVGIHLIAATVALGGALAVRAFARRVLAPLDDAPLWPWLAALLWFLSPLLLYHTMNGLETGLYTALLLLTLLQFGRVLTRGAAAGPGDRLLLGALGGLVFLARNDAVFLVTAIFAIWALHELVRVRAGFVPMLRRLVPPGLASLAVAAPWLINNQIRFGSIVPISGSAQSLTAEFGQNAGLLPVKIFEYLFPMLPVPGGVEGTAGAIWGGTIVAALVVALFLVQLVRRGGPVLWAMVGAYLLHGMALASYYGLYFGAAHFMGRYLAPVAPLLIVAALWAAIELGRVFWSAGPRLLAQAYGVGGLALSALLLGRLLLPGVHDQGHGQVVRWVQANVPEVAWVGAVQTGTLGYWHDRTINLDGKVNPRALAERREKGTVLPYVVNDSQIDYIVDWAGVGGWIERDDGGFSEAFDLVIRDEAANLAVMRRKILKTPEN